MTADLFAAQERVEPIPLQDAELYYLPRLALAQAPVVVLRRLIDEVPWRAESIVVWGKTHPQPRLIAWYGDVGKNYTYSGIQLTPLPWTKALLDIRKRVEAVAGADFNSVLLNYYRDHRDSMGLHSDDEPELGKRPILASLSLGEERIFILKHKRAKALKPVRLKLASGSLLLMKGDTQRYWKHGIDKETRPLRATRQLDVSSHHMKLSANCAKHALFNKKLSRNSLGAPSTISGPTDKCLNCRSSNRSW